MAEALILPVPHHRDPFDRLLVAQALGGWTLATADPRIAPYGVPTLWA